MNIWKSYMWTAGWRIIWKKIVTVIDATFAAAKRKPEEIQACQDSNPWPLWYRCIALPVELTSQLGAGRWISSYYTRKTMYDFHIFITSSSSFHGFNTNQFNKVFWWLERNLKAVIVSTNPLQLKMNSRSKSFSFKVQWEPAIYPSGCDIDRFPLEFYLYVPLL